MLFYFVVSPSHASFILGLHSLNLICSPQLFILPQKLISLHHNVVMKLPSVAMAHIKSNTRIVEDPGWDCHKFAHAVNTLFSSSLTPNISFLNLSSLLLTRPPYLSPPTPLSLSLSPCVVRLTTYLSPHKVRMHAYDNLTWS